MANILSFNQIISNCCAWNWSVQINQRSVFEDSLVYLLICMVWNDPIKIMIIMLIFYECFYGRSWIDPFITLVWRFHEKCFYNQQKQPYYFLKTILNNKTCFGKCFIAYSTFTYNKTDLLGTVNKCYSSYKFCFTQTKE